jgi:hypothetical protein
VYSNRTFRLLPGLDNPDTFLRLTQESAMTLSGHLGYVISIQIPHLLTIGFGVEHELEDSLALIDLLIDTGVSRNKPPHVCVGIKVPDNVSISTSLVDLGTVERSIMLLTTGEVQVQDREVFNKVSNLEEHILFDMLGRLELSKGDSILRLRAIEVDDLILWSRERFFSREDSMGTNLIKGDDGDHASESISHGCVGGGLIPRRGYYTVG